MSRIPFDRLVRERIVVFDGAMGTELYRRHQFVNVCYDELSVSRPELVREIHLAAVRAGADVVTTNSFGANRYKLAGFLLGDRAREIARAAAAVAREAAGDKCYVAGSVGPLGRRVGLGGTADEISETEAEAAFEEPLAGLLEGGADFAILESFGRRQELLCALRASARVGLACIPSMAFGDGETTRHGESLDTFYAPFPEGVSQPLMLGFNCGVGPREMLDHLERFIPGCPYPVLVQPNAGAPQMVSDRMIYHTSPEYLATYAQHFVQLGARAVGGCCGTGPEHVAALAAAVKAARRTPVELISPSRPGVEEVEPLSAPERSRFAARLAAGRWVTSVELVPPLGWDATPTVERARACLERGVDAINIPDGPRASSRMSPLITALQIQDRVGIEVVLHVACRDRNIIGMQSDLLGCAAAGIRNLLIITGDPPKAGDYPFATAVFDIDSIGLTRIVSRLNRGVDIGGHPVRPPTPFFVGVGANPTFLDQDREVARFEQKAEAGASFAITQPVYDPDALFRFLRRVEHCRVPVLAGIWPLASLRNAEFLNNEVPGVSVPERLIRRMAAATDREAARAEGVAISREIVAEVRGAVAGAQVSAPFGNVQTALAVLAPEES